jgi:hypothetical protein
MEKTKDQTIKEAGPSRNQVLPAALIPAGGAKSIPFLLLGVVLAEEITNAPYELRPLRSVPV